MIDRDLIASLEGTLPLDVKRAFATISNSGVIKRQLARALTQLAADADTDDDEAMRRRLKGYRNFTRFLESLEELGFTLEKELP